MQWPNAEELADLTRSISEHEVSVLHSHEIIELITKLKDWYPDIEVGTESIHLESEFYEGNCFLADNLDSRARSIIPIVVKQERQIIAFVSFQFEERSGTLTSRLGAVNPKNRGEKIGHLGPALLEALGNYLKAGLIFYQATLKIPHQQVIAERMGFQLVGIMPAIDLDLVEAGKVRRVFEAQYAKVLANESEVQRPDFKNLTEKTKALYDVLFPASSAGRQPA
jgi:hypothetical protein